MGPDDAAAQHRVSVIPLPYCPSSVPRARRAVLDVLGRWGILDAEPVAAIELMVSELVTNAVVHGRPPVILECETRGDDFVIRVYDGSTAPIDVFAECPDAAAERGRGLAIVKALAKKSRIDVGASGTTATASLSL